MRGRPLHVTICLSALTHNLRQVKKYAPKSAVLAMVKANAYGHGMISVAKALHEADGFGVACLEEGEALRQAGIEQPIILMEGLFREEEWDRAVQGRFTWVVHHPHQIELLEKKRAAPPQKIWLKINTGMHRLGFSPNEVPQMIQRLMQCASVQKPIGLMTHFAESDVLESTTTQKQFQLFETLTKEWKGIRSLANSGAILSHPETHADWVRPGIMLYGVSPFLNQQGKSHGLKPVMFFQSALIATHTLQKGDRVGYGGTWAAPETLRIGIVAGGYGDGYPRHAENGTPVLVKGERCSLVGRVSMDMMAVDLRGKPDAVVGDPVLFWGEGLPVETVASHCGTSSYELLTRIASRVPVVLES